MIGEYNAKSAVVIKNSYKRLSILVEGLNEMQNELVIKHERDFLASYKEHMSKV